MAAMTLNPTAKPARRQATVEGIIEMLIVIYTRTATASTIGMIVCLFIGSVLNSLLAHEVEY